MKVNIETLRELKAGGFNKPDGISDEDWASCDTTRVPVAEASPSVPVVQNIKPVAAAIPGSGRKALTIEDMKSSGMSVDEILRVKNGTMRIGDQVISQPIKVKVLFSEFAAKWQIKAKNPVTGTLEYFSSYDGVMEHHGEMTFDEAVALCKRWDDKAYAYKSADIVMVVSEDVIENGKIVARAGTRLGYSTAPTANKYLTNFLKSCSVNGIDLEAGEANATVSLLRCSGNGNEWCVPKFELA